MNNWNGQKSLIGSFQKKKKEILKINLYEKIIDLTQN